jgi:hypothetical protein
LVLDVIAVLGGVHPFPKHPEKFLSKFNPDRKDSTEDHIKKYILVVRLLNFKHEDVMCRPFPYTFEGKSSTRYFSLSQASITRWNIF